MKNVPIRILSPQFEPLGEIDNYESLQFIRRFFKVGEFELHININKKYTNKLQENNLIMLGNAVNKVGIIMHRENGFDENGEETDQLIVKGPTLNGITQRRLTMPDTTGYDRINDNAETIMKHYVNNNIVNPVDPARKISNVSISTDIKRGIQVPWQTRFEVLSDVLNQIGEWCNLGWDVILDITNQKWVFDVYEGRNLTSGQSILPPVTFSTDFENVKSQHFIDSALNYKNVAYAGGQGEEEERLILQVGEISGFDRIETFIDCSQAADSIELTTQGQQKLDELKKIKSFEVKILPEGSFIYEKDYDLGDIVTAQSLKWGITMDARIIELKEIYEVDGFNLDATFGTNIPNLYTIIKKNIKQLVR